MLAVISCKVEKQMGIVTRPHNPIDRNSLLVGKVITKRNVRESHGPNKVEYK